LQSSYPNLAYDRLEQGKLDFKNGQNKRFRKLDKDGLVGLNQEIYRGDVLVNKEEPKIKRDNVQKNQFQS